MAFPFPESIIERNEVPEKTHHLDSTTDKPATTGDKPAIENVNFQKIIDYLKTNDSITNAIAMELVGLQASQTRQILREMVEQQLLETQGEKRNRSYVTKETRAHSYGE